MLWSNEPPGQSGLVLLTNVYAYEPTDGIPAAYTNYILGAEGPCWSERISSLLNMEFKMFPRLSAIAEVDWTAPGLKNWTDFTNRLTTHKLRLKRMGVNYNPSATPPQLGTWTPAQTPATYSTLTWDITASVTEAGEIDVSFCWKTGAQWPGNRVGRAAGKRSGDRPGHARGIYRSHPFEAALYSAPAGAAPGRHLHAGGVGPGPWGDGFQRDRVSPELELLKSMKTALCKLVIAVALMLASVAGAPAQALSMRTLAGGTTPGATNGFGSNARFNHPQAVAADSAGNIYVADTENGTVRKITPDGYASTLAGLAGSYGSADGSGASARFYGPQGIATDGAGQVYVADTANSTIRTVSAAGAVSTLAGEAGVFNSLDGAGANAQFYHPEGMAVDFGGNLYVADTWNHTIRKITPAGLVSTLAGLAGNFGGADGSNSKARFNRPTAIAVDGATNLFVADSFNHTIRKITPAGRGDHHRGSARGLGQRRRDQQRRPLLPAAGNQYRRERRAFRGGFGQPDPAKSFGLRHELGGEHRGWIDGPGREHEWHGQQRPILFSGRHRVG